MNDFILQILHTADQEAGLPAIEDAVNFSAVLNALEDDFENTLKLSSGDIFIAGPFLNTSRDIYEEGEPGIADILINNALGFQAVAIGNHEFDLGPDALDTLIRPNAEITGPGIPEGGYPGTAFPYLSLNLDFTAEAGLAELVVEPGQTPQPNTITDSVIIDVNGEPIGVVGAVTPTLPSIANTGDIVVTPADFDDINALAAEIQPVVDGLTSQGINKIVFMGHMQQIAVEDQLAELLTDVDVIIAGGSNTLLANEDDPLRDGDDSAGPYPIEKTSASGEPVYLINTDGNYRYVGQFVAQFNENGIITDILEETGTYATDDAGVDRVYGEDVNPADVADPVIVEVTNAISEIVTEKDGNVFGQTDVFLNGTRASVRTEETNLGNLSADANLSIAQEYDPTVTVSLKNGGGIRDNIGVSFIPPGGISNEVVTLPPQGIEGIKADGQISQLDIENALRFNNDLALLTVTAEELKQILEHGVAAVEPGATPGQFPQVGGLAFSYDPSQPAIEFERDANQNAIGVAVEGERVQSLAILDESGEVADIVVENGEVVGDPSREFRLVTLGFLADGGDGYPFELLGENRVNLIEQPAPNTNLETFTDDGTEQDALAEYLAENFPADDDPNTPAFENADVDITEDTRIQNLAVREDTVLGDDDGTDAIEGTEGDDELVGTPENDAILALAGNDTVAGGLGADNLDGGDGNDILRGDFNSRSSGGTVGGNDTLTGGAGDDRMGGKAGNDELYGEDGNDALWGDDGDDLLRGGSGNDILVGDDFSGGNGADTFVLAVGEGTDTIVDFEVGVDLIQLENGITFEDLTLTASGSSVGIVVDDEALAVVQGVTALSAADFI
jgi:2',3'-cyclic-nucleotide 2'-phosphodiesterase (5'-nucleotidase family)